MTGYSPRPSGPVNVTAATAGGTAAVGPAGPVEAIPDPWGVRRAENLLTSLEGILSARVVTTPLGEVSEVHVLAQAGLQAKQLVRNIESALLAQLGLKMDHRKISIAQTAEVQADRGAGAGAVRDKVLQRALLFENMTVAPGKRPHRIAITVTLSFRGQTETAEEEASDTPRSRVEGAAKASVTVIDRLLTDFSIALEGAKIVDAFDREFAFVAVQGLGGRETLAADRHGGDQGERGARGGLRGAGRDEPVDRGPAAGLVAGGELGSGCSYAPVFSGRY